MSFLLETRELGQHKIAVQALQMIWHKFKGFSFPLFIFVLFLSTKSRVAEFAPSRGFAWGVHSNF